MAEEEYLDKYRTMVQPWWANDMMILVMTMVNIVIIVYDIENNLYTTNNQLWWILSVIDLVLIFFFIFDLIEDHSRCTDKKWWYKTHAWEFLGLFPMFLTGFAIFRVGGWLRFLRLFRAFSGILRLIGATRRAKEVTVGQQMMHLFFIVFTIIITGGFLVYVFESEYWVAMCAGVANPPSNCSRVVHDLPTALWWSLVTTTTVGFGDYAPVTNMGRIIASVLMLIGIGLVGSLAATFSQMFYSTRAGEGKTSAGSSANDQIATLDNLALRMEKGLLKKQDYETAVLLVRQRMLVELRSLRLELSTLTTLPVPLQVASKMKLDGLMADYDHKIDELNIRLEEE